MSTFTLIINIFEAKERPDFERNFITIPGFSSRLRAQEEGAKAVDYYRFSDTAVSIYIVEVS